MITHPDRLTVFAFLWAYQALIHQEFYSKWIDKGDPFGWLVAILALATLLRPRFLIVLASLAISSCVYNITKWPFVPNHILVETIVNLAILRAIAMSAVSDRGVDRGTRREHIFDRFCPVLTTMLVVMYYFAFLAKLNHDSLDPDYSCAVVLYGDLVKRFPFLPTAEWTKMIVIWSTIGIEFAIPILFTFNKTRYLAIFIGLPFHFMLELIRHRTFSGLAYALYGLFLIRPLAVVVGEAFGWLRQRFGSDHTSRLCRMVAIIVVLGTSILIAAYMLGNYNKGIGPLNIFRIPWLIWIGWSLGLMLVYGIAMVGGQKIERECNNEGRPNPGLVWLLMIIVFFNGTSQYIGLKTETCFTMYSNLRTEGPFSNHLFLPALRFAGYQDDLVDIIATDHEKLRKFLQQNLLITHFEFKRAMALR